MPNKKTEAELKAGEAEAAAAKTDEDNKTAATAKAKEQAQLEDEQKAKAAAVDIAAFNPEKLDVSDARAEVKRDMEAAALTETPSGIVDGAKAEVDAHNLAQLKAYDPAYSPAAAKYHEDRKAAMKERADSMMTEALQLVAEARELDAEYVYTPTAVLVARLGSRPIIGAPKAPILGTASPTGTPRTVPPKTSAPFVPPATPPAPAPTPTPIL